MISRHENPHAPAIGLCLQAREAARPAHTGCCTQRPPGSHLGGAYSPPILRAAQAGHRQGGVTKVTATV